MLICPYCEQGIIIKAKIKKLNKKILVCPECDTIWEKDCNLNEGVFFAKFMKKNGLENNWDELEIIK